MSDLKAKMHPNRFRLGLHSRPRWGCLQRSPDPLAGFKGPSIRQGGYRKGGEGEREGKKGGEGNGGKEGGDF